MTLLSKLRLNPFGPRGILYSVKTATIEELRADPDCLERWISAGEEVCIVKDGAPFANVLPFHQNKAETDAQKKTFEVPDFKARIKRIWGDRVFTEEEEQEMRDAEDGVIE